MHPKSFFSWALPGPGGRAYSAPPHPLAGFKGPTSKGGEEGKGREGEGREQERGGEEGREEGKKKGGEGGKGRGRDLPDQCEIASYVPAIAH